MPERFLVFPCRPPSSLEVQHGSFSLVFYVGQSPLFSRETVLTLLVVRADLSYADNYVRSLLQPGHLLPHGPPCLCIQGLPCRS